MFGCRGKKKDLSAAFLNKEVIDKMGKPWVFGNPGLAAMDDLLKAYDSGHARYKKGNNVHEAPSSARLISLDPGVRTFLTGYTPDSEVLTFGQRYQPCKEVEDEKGCSQDALSDSKSGRRFALPDCPVFVYDIQSYHPTDLSGSTDGETQGVDAGGSGPRQHELWQIGPITNSNNDFSTKRENINLAKSSWYLRPRLVRHAEDMAVSTTLRVVKRTHVNNVSLNAIVVSMVREIFGSLPYSEPGSEPGSEEKSTQQ
ncbi:hypothetical protein V1522DRAFT_448884 [Lipomyces starkeyi]